MLNRVATFVAFVCGCAFTIALLVQCGGPGRPAHASGSDGGVDGGTPETANQDGTRLRTKVEKGSDGSSQFLNLYDTQLQTDCSWQPMSDGTTRCVPSTSVGSNGGYFSDAACTMPFYFSAGPSSNTCPAPAVPTYLSLQVNFIPDGGCSRTIYTRYFTLSSTPASPDTIYSMSGLGSCLGQPIADFTCSPGPCAFYPPIREMAPSEFVEGTVAVE